MVDDGAVGRGAARPHRRLRGNEERCRDDEEQVPHADDLLKASGVPVDDIERAEADGTLGLLAIDQIILADQGPRYTRAEVEGAGSGLGDDAGRGSGARSG